MVKIRSYNSRFDRARVEDLERRCEVAELGNEIVGVIRGTVKVVTIKKNPKNPVKVGYVLGLRVSPIHRRKGIGSSLVRHIEEWFLSRNVDYAYMATEKDNEASIKLFIHKFGYVRFKTPSILVHPVGRRPNLRPSAGVRISKVSVECAEFLYRSFMGGSADFFPVDIDKIVRNKLSLGTWVAFFRGDSSGEFGGTTIAELPKSWAMLSVWNCAQLFKLTLGRQTLSCSLYGTIAKLLNDAVPCLRPPSSLPDLVGPFGFYFVYGLHREGPLSGKLVRALWKFVCNNNLLVCGTHDSDHDNNNNVKLIVTEVGCCDDNKHLRLDIPHWRLLSCPEDLWCIKALKNNEQKQSLQELIANSKGALFVDPREV
ncbi:probable N-acetyltransferase HLS1-like isoform X2 [Ipomoea triloba]|uniref:probable N-acetyltransferase HLS1-like isoform X2 n=1 Tax=Ipomoea triloba TaxID=35885 RepID=UPI00125D4489|nr:probable N-acetyltransferase HLS1-like isoform X2 [Ipomoea triloba]